MTLVGPATGAAYAPSQLSSQAKTWLVENSGDFMRHIWKVALAICLVGMLGASGSSVAAADADEAKLSPALKQLVAQGGYGDIAVTDWIPNYDAGDIYYL